MEKCQSLPKRSPDNSLQDWVAFMRKVKKTISLVACHWKEDKGTRERIKVSKKHKRFIHGKSWFDHWKGNRWKKSHYKKTKNPTVEKEWSNSHGEKWDHIKTLKSSLEKRKRLHDFNMRTLFLLLLQSNWHLLTRDLCCFFFCKSPIVMLIRWWLCVKYWLLIENAVRKGKFPASYSYLDC